LYLKSCTISETRTFWQFCYRVWFRGRGVCTITQRRCP